MRTTLDLPNDLGTEVKLIAVQENKTIKVLISELLRAGLKSRQLAQNRSFNLPELYQPNIRFDRATIHRIFHGKEVSR